MATILDNKTNTDADADANTNNESPTWRNYLEKYRLERNFIPDNFVNYKVSKLNDYMILHQLSGVVLSVSGGVDSAVTLGLLKRALDAKNSPIKKIWAISQPICSSAWALERAQELCAKFSVELITIDQTEIYKSLIGQIEKETDVKTNKFSGGQLKSYMRTPVNYFATQLLSQEGTPAVVIGTGNMDEDGYLAYFCKAGDGVVDIQLISDLHKNEVYLLGKHLGIPDSILSSAPSADLWDGQEDENELGFPYEFVEFFVGWYLKLSSTDRTHFVNSLTGESFNEFSIFRTKCESVHDRNKHKLVGVVNL